MFLMVMSLSASITLTLNNDLNRRGFDVRIGFEERQSANRVTAMLRSVPGVAEAELWLLSPVAILKEGQRTKEAGIGAELVGIPADSQMYKPFIVTGRWFESGDERVIVINQETADDNNIHLGDMVTLNLFELGDAEWRVIGLFQTIFAGGFDAEPVYAPLAAVYDATKRYNEGSRLLVRTSPQDSETVALVYNALKDLYATRNMDIDVFSTGTTPEDRAFAVSQFDVTISMLLALTVIVAVVGGISLMGALSISVVERTREIGVMRAIGARSRTILGMFMMEGVLQGVLSWVIAVPISFALTQPLSNALGQAMFEANLDYQYNFGAVLAWLVIMVVISTLASILPARSATQISVRESLAYA